MKNFNPPFVLHHLPVQVRPVKNHFPHPILGDWADRFSNKTIIAAGGPLYILCIIGWCFVGIYTHLYANLILLVLIHIGNGVATAGINLSLANIDLKLAPSEDAIAESSTQKIIIALFSSVS